MAIGKNICVVGLGRMGVGISKALLLSNQGYRIEPVDPKERDPGREFEALNRTKEEIASNLNLLKDLGELPAPTEQLMENLY